MLFASDGWVASSGETMAVASNARNRYPCRPFPRRV